MNNSTANKKIAIVHDWLVIYGGAEKVLENILDLYPNADLYSLIDRVPSSQRVFLRGKKVRTSILQRLPAIEKYYRYLMPVLPIIIEQFDLSAYDIIISSSYCVSKGVLTGPNQLHISYCHSPIRYAWDQYHYYIQHFKKLPIVGVLMRFVFHYVRIWDVVSSNSVDTYIATSRFVSSRIEKYYRRSSIVVPPPVDLSTFTLSEIREDYYVCISRFVPFKRLDIAVKAFAEMPSKRLLMIGDGPDMNYLKAMSAINIEFIGFQNPQTVHHYLSRARALIFPSEEDFGIVPLEAQASGTPVIAFGKGGILDTVVPYPSQLENPTGVFFNSQDHLSLIEAVNNFERNIQHFDSVAIANHARLFSVENFKSRFNKVLQQLL